MIKPLQARHMLSKEQVLFSELFREKLLVPNHCSTVKSGTKNHRLSDRCECVVDSAFVYTVRK
jgi:hypothetical protein